MPEPTRAEYDGLRQAMLETKNIAGYWMEFLDHWAVREEFLDACMPTRAPQLESTLLEICRKIFGPELQGLDNVKMFRAEAGPLVHGAFFVAGEIGGFLYFEDLETGVLVVSTGPERQQAARFRTSLGRGVVTRAASPS